MTNVLCIKLTCFFFDTVKIFKSLYNYFRTNKFTSVTRLYCLILALNVPSQVKCLNVQIYITNINVCYVGSSGLIHFAANEKH